MSIKLMNLARAYVFKGSISFVWMGDCLERGSRPR